MHVCPSDAVSLMLVEMERSYITAGFFRSTMYKRTNKIKEQEAMMAAGSKATAKGVPAASGGGAAPKGKSYFPAFGGAKEAEPAPAGPTSTAPSVADGASDGGSDDTASKKDGAGKCLCCCHLLPPCWSSCRPEPSVALLLLWRHRYCDLPVAFLLQCCCCLSLSQSALHAVDLKLFPACNLGRIQSGRERPPTLTVPPSLAA